MCKDKELKKYLSIANKRRITGGKEKQLKAKNWLFKLILEFVKLYVPVLYAIQLLEL